MRDLFRYLTAGASFLFGLLVLAFTAWRTLDLLSLVMPGEVIFHTLGLVLFDVGFVLWTMTFIFHAEGLVQRAVALAGAVLGLGFTILAVVLDLLIGGQTLVAVPDWAGWLALALLSVSVAANLALLFLFHITMPLSLAAIRAQQQRDRQAAAIQSQEDLVEREALDLFAARRGQISAQLAERLAEGMTGRLSDAFGAPRPEASVVERHSLNGAAESATPKAKGK